VKDVLWCGLLKLDVPHQGNTIRFMRSIFVIVIGGNQQLGILKERKERSTRQRERNTEIRMLIKTCTHVESIKDS